MSARKFPRDCPRAVQHAVRVAFDLADETGEVRGGMGALQGALEHDSERATRNVVAEGERWGYFRRVGPIGHGPRRLFVVEARLKSAGVCEMPACSRPTTIGRWCQACKQVMRADREWWQRAVEMAVAKASPPTIAAVLNQPLWPEPENKGVVFTLLAECPHLLSDEWRDALREHSPQLFADEHGKSGGRLTQRRRDRRGRRARSPLSTLVVPEVTHHDEARR